MPGPLSHLARLARWTVVVYVIVAVLWVVLSDHLLRALFVQPARATIATFKDSAFVVVSTIMLYSMLNAQIRRLQKEELVRIGISRDLEEREQFLQAVLRSATAGFWELDLRGNIIDVNEAYSKMSGYSREELLAMNVADIDTTKSPEDVIAHIRAVADTGGEIFEAVHRRKDGSTFPAEISTKYLPARGGRVVAFNRDLTDRNRAIDALEQRVHLQQRLEQIATAVPGAIWTLERRQDGTFTVPYASPSLEGLTGYTPEDVSLGVETILSCIHPEDRAGLLAQIARSAREMTALDVEVRLNHPARGEIWVEGRSAPQRTPSGSTIWHGYAHDITARKNTEVRLRQLSLAVEQSPASIIIADTSGLVEYTNPRFTQVTGWTSDEVRGLSFELLKAGDASDIHPPADWLHLTAGQMWYGEVNNRRKDGTPLAEFATVSPVVNEVGRVTHLLAVLEDVTERHLLEAQSRHSQKMEAMGLLTGGIAHDFNNILQVILGWVSFLHSEAELPTELCEPIREIGDAANRASALTRQLLAFNRRHSLAPRTVNLVDLLTGITRMLRRVLSGGIAIEVVESPSPVYVHADPALLDHALVNLSLNARDAMPRGGRLFLECFAATFQDPVDEMHPERQPGNFACVAVRDTGCGITPDALPHIFEPFYTTKSEGRGTGLGLATASGIVRQHGGWIEVESTLGEGTTFRIYLPREAELDRTDIPEAQLAVQGGNETILLVEDETNVCELIRLVLTRLDYTVYTAATASAAITEFERHRDAFDMLLTDVVMPGEMNGRELAEHLKLEKPSLRVLYMTGHTSLPMLANVGEDLLAKPFTRSELAQSVRRVLDRAPQKTDDGASDAALERAPANG